MTDSYNRNIAGHYRAYRPLLHKLILSMCLDETSFFNKGLDIGCGVGHSAIALSKYCDQVIGIEPSRNMRNLSICDEKVTYLDYKIDRLPFSSKDIGIVTFAGSLKYARSEHLLTDLWKVCESEALLIVYDFEILLRDIWEELGIEILDKAEKRENQQDFVVTI